MDLTRAEESLQAAGLCFENRLYNASASRSYYAMFQAAVVALSQAGFRQGEWSHIGLQATFANQLTRRRKLYPRSLVPALQRALYWRNEADYGAEGIGHRKAEQMLRWAKEFVETVEEVTGHGTAR